MSPLDKILPNGKRGSGKAVSELYESGRNCLDCNLPIMAYDVELGGFGTTTQYDPCACAMQGEQTTQVRKEIDVAAIERENERLNRQHRFSVLKLGYVDPEYNLERIECHDGNLRAAVAVKTFLEKAIASESLVGMPGFALYGPNSVGKSHLAGGLVSGLMQAKIGAVMACPQRIQEGMQRTYADGSKVKSYDFAADLREVPLLVIDDVGREHVLAANGNAKEFYQSELVAILDDRIAHKLPVVITTNYTPTDLAKRYSAGAFGTALIERFIKLFGGTSSNWIHITDTHSRRTGSAIKPR